MIKTVAIDLDGTLAAYDFWRGVTVIGPPVKGAVEFVKRLVAAGYDVVVHTARVCDREDGYERGEVALVVQAWLEREGFPPEVRVWAEVGKPAAVAYVDDRAVPVTTNPHESEFSDAYLRIVGLTAGARR